MKRWTDKISNLPELANDSYLVEPQYLPPEKRLLAAILVRAAQDAVKSPGVTLSDHRQACNYIGIGNTEPNLSWSDGKSFFSFVELCEQLELCPYTIHAELSRLYHGPSLKRKLYNVGAGHPIIQYLY